MDVALKSSNNNSRRAFYARFAPAVMEVDLQPQAHRAFRTVESSIVLPQSFHVVELDLILKGL
jgi:hypothetical protein